MNFAFEFEMYSHKMILVKELFPHYFQDRLICHNLWEFIPAYTVVFFRDEAHFHLSGYVNEQHTRYWSASNPHEIHESTLNDDKVTVWFAIPSESAPGPYFFKDNISAPVTIKSDRYVDILKSLFELNLNNCSNF